MPPPSPALTSASRSSVSSVASQLRSMLLSRSESDGSSSNGSPRHDLTRSRTEAGLLLQYPSHETINIGTPSRLYESYGRRPPTTASVSSSDSWNEFERRSQNSWHDDLSRNDGAATTVVVSGSAMQEPDDENFSSLSHELVRTYHEDLDRSNKTSVDEV
jgi:hypothetical protein